LPAHICEPDRVLARFRDRRAHDHGSLGDASVAREQGWVRVHHCQKKRQRRGRHESDRASAAQTPQHLFHRGENAAGGGYKKKHLQSLPTLQSLLKYHRHHTK
jgi:hypothetical protein